MIKKFSSRKNKFCRICLSKILTTYLNLGNQPPSNSFINKNEIKKEQFFSLKVQLCGNCGLSQLDTTVEASDIFNDYVYLSSSSKALINHYSKMVGRILKKIKPKKKSLIVDIGSNDGITLKRYPKNHFTLLGIEPSSASKYAKGNGIKNEKKFFDYNFSKIIKKKYGLAKIVTATNVFAHVDKIRNFTRGISNILESNGVFVVEFPYIKNMLSDNYFDLIYHEHLCYFSVNPLNKLFNDFGLKIFDIETFEASASGPGLRLYVCLSKSKKFKINKIVKSYLNKEIKMKLNKISTYKKFGKKINYIKKNIEKILFKLKQKNYALGAFGAPAKGNTMLNFLNNSNNLIEAVADNTVEKIGKLTPGTHIPIINDDSFMKKNIKYCLLLSWNYLDFFIKNSEFIKKGGKFIVPFPKPRIVPNEKN